MQDSIDKWTRIYGASDDLIEIDGGFNGEHGKWNTSHDEPVLIIVSDGTLLKVWYEKDGQAIWGVELVRKGTLFDRIDQCVDEEADPYSDVAHFRPGVTWAYAAEKWSAVG